MRFSTIVILALAIIAQASQVSAVACEKDSDCTDTDFVKAKCTKKVCECKKTDYVATTVGCVEKLKKPKVSADITEAVKDAEADVTCGGPALDNVVYVWYKNEETKPIKDADKKAYKTPKIDADIKLQCAVQLKGLDNTRSELSDAITISLLEDGGTSKASPKLTVPSCVAKGRKFKPECTGQPFGVTGITINEKGETTAVTEVTQPADPTGKKLECTFKEGTIKFTKTEIDFPKLCTDIDTVSITSSVDIGSKGVIVKTGEKIALTCEESPAEKYLPEDYLKDVAYSWSHDTAKTTKLVELTSATNEDFDSIKCTIKPKGKDSKTSSPLPKITFSSKFPSKPEIIATPKKPLVGKNVALTCSQDNSDVTITWKKGADVLVGQTDKTIQLTKLKKDETDKFTCEVQGFNLKATSDEFTLKAVETLSKPTIKGETTVGRYGDLELECDSDNDDGKIKFAWKKNGQAITTAKSKNLEIKDVKKSAEGKYSCTTSSGSLTSDASDEVKVKVVEPGKPCTKNSDCEDEDNMTGTCDTNSKRCTCKKGYFQSGNECENGVTQMVSSLALVFVAAVFTRLF